MIKTADKQFRLDVQILRGISVLAVIFFHAFERKFPNGYLGVDIFFVISGFIVTPLIWNVFARWQESSTREKVQALKSFYIRRFTRLAPAFAAALVFAYLMTFAFGPVSGHLRVANQGLASIFLIGNMGAYLYSGGNYFAPNPNPLVHLWSLSYDSEHLTPHGVSRFIKPFEDAALNPLTLGL